MQLLLAIGEAVVLRAFLLLPASLPYFHSISFLVLEILSKARIIGFAAADKQSSILHSLYF